VLQGNRKGCPYVLLPGSKEQMPTLTTVVGSFRGALAAGLGQEIAADLLKERTIDRWLDAGVNHDIQEALRRAFAAAVGDLLEEYRTSGPWRELSAEQRTLVGERCALLRSRQVIAQLFPTVDDRRGELPDEDVARLFTADHETVNEEMLALLGEECRPPPCPPTRLRRPLSLSWAGSRNW